MNALEEIKKNLGSILDGDNQKLVENAEKLGKHLATKGLTTSQIRNVFDVAKRISWSESAIDKLNLLRPKLAYTAGRHRKKMPVIVDLQEILDGAIQEVVKSKGKKKFTNFQNFFEAIVSYHRRYGKE